MFNNLLCSNHFNPANEITLCGYSRYNPGIHMAMINHKVEVPLCLTANIHFLYLELLLHFSYNPKEVCFRACGFLFILSALRLEQHWPQSVVLSISGQLPSGWPQMAPAWPSTPSMYYTLVRVFPTTFGCHRAFLSNLPHGWPWLTPAWPLTPTLHRTLVKGSFYQIWMPSDIPEQFDPWLTPMWPLTPAMHYTSIRGSSYQICLP